MRARLLGDADPTGSKLQPEGERVDRQIDKEGKLKGTIMWFI